MILVVQLEPAPMPIFTQSAPAFIKSSVASGVATFPAIKSKFGNSFFTSLTNFKTNSEWPCAVSTTIASTPTFMSALILSCQSSLTLMAAATLNLPFLSLVEKGNSSFLVKSLTVIKPSRLFCLSTTNNLSILCF